MTTVKLSDYREWASTYEEAFSRGETVQECTACAWAKVLPPRSYVVERDASWMFWPGQGVILHPHCVGHWLRAHESAVWMSLALHQYLEHGLDRMAVGGTVRMAGDTRSYRRKLEQNAAEYPDSYSAQSLKWYGYTDRAHEYMDLAQVAVGIPIMERGFSVENPNYDEHEPEED